MKKPLIAIITDTHLSESNIDLNIDIFRQARRYCLENNLTYLFHGGDIFHSRKSQSLSVLNTFLKILDEFTEDGIILVAIPGNHDKTDYQSTASFLDPFKNHPNFKLHKTPTFIYLNEIPILLFPFFSDEEYLKYFSDLSHEKVSLKDCLVLTHIGFSGAVMNNGVSVKSISPSLFSKFKKVLVGHYHDYQEVGENIVYIGSAYQHNYGESWEDKGLTAIEENGNLKLIPLNFPKYINLEVDIDKLTPIEIREIVLEKENSIDNLRVTLMGSEEKLKSFSKKELVEGGISIQVKPTKISIEEVSSNIEPFTHSTLIEHFKEFCKKNKLENIDKGLNYLEKALKIKQ